MKDDKTTLTEAKTKSDLKSKLYPLMNLFCKNYIGKMGYSSDECWNFDKNKPKLGFEIIDKTDSINLDVRPRKGTTIMLNLL